MYVGHFAAGHAIKAREPRAPTWALLVGVGLLDILFGPFVLAGIERATVTPSISPGFSLDYIDWSHSLLMFLVWSVLFASAFARYGRSVMMAIGFSVFSHFLLDLPMHPPDLALWPTASAHLGLGLWRDIAQRLVVFRARAHRGAVGLLLDAIKSRRIVWAPSLFDIRSSGVSPRAQLAVVLTALTKRPIELRILSFKVTTAPAQSGNHTTSLGDGAHSHA